MGNPPIFDLDAVLCQVPAGLREDIIARPKFVAVPRAGHPQRCYGFDVAIPVLVWREYLVPHVQTLLDEPVCLFGQLLRNYGWFASITPLGAVMRSADNAVWLHFYDPTYQDEWLGHYGFANANNLTCAPGVAAALRKDG